MAVKALPNGIFVGESTWGATGPLVGTNVYNAGQFEISSYLTVQTASCKFKFLDNKIYEGIGIPPDYYVPYNSTEISNKITN